VSEFQWTDRLRLWEAGELAEQPGWLDAVLSQLGLPEVMLLIGVGVIVCYMLEAIGQKGIGKMTLLVAIFSAASVLIENIARIAETLKGG
jgi:hypothetical protein